MHKVDSYRQAVEIANERTFSMFKIYGPYEPGTEAHIFWLKIFDKFFN